MKFRKITILTRTCSREFHVSSHFEQCSLSNYWELDSYAFFPLISIVNKVRCIIMRDIFESATIYYTRLYGILSFALKNTWLLFIVLLFLLLIFSNIIFPLENISSLLDERKHDVLERCRNIFNVSCIAVSCSIVGVLRNCFLVYCDCFQVDFQRKRQE